MYFFYDSSRPRIIMSGAYFTQWNKTLGEVKRFYNRVEIEQLSKVLSITLGKRLLSLKSGKSLKLSYLHSVGSLMIRRLTDEEKSLVERNLEINQEKYKINQIIRSKCKEEYLVLNSLIKSEKENEKILYKLDIKI